MQRLEIKNLDIEVTPTDKAWLLLGDKAAQKDNKHVSTFTKHAPANRLFYKHQNVKLCDVGFRNCV